MATNTHKSVFTFGGKTDSSFKGVTGFVKKSISGVSKEIRETKKEQAKLRNEIKKGRAAGKDVSELENKYEDLTNTVERLTRRQGQLNKAQASFGKAGGAFKSAGKQLMVFTGIASIATGATVGLANSVANSSDQIGKQAAKFGLGTEKLQEYRFAADKMAGVNAQRFDVAFQRMTRRVAEFSELGKGEAAGALQELGIFADDVRDKKPDQIFELIADRMSHVEDASTRLRLGFKLFDSEGVDLVNMFGKGSAGIREMGEEAHRLNGVLSGQATKDAEKYKDSLTGLTFQFNGMINQFGVRLLPILTKSFDRISTNISENQDKIDLWIDRGVTFASEVIPDMISGGIELGEMAFSLAGNVNNVVEFFGGWETVAKGLGLVLAGKFTFGVIQAAIGVVQFAKGLPWVATGIKAITTAMFANPVGLIIAGGFVVGAALIKWIWGDFGTWWENTWEGITWIAQGAWNVIKFLFKWSPIGILFQTWKPVSGFFMNLFRRLRGIFGPFFKWIGKLFKNSPMVWLATKGFGIAKKLVGFNSDEDAQNEIAKRVAQARARRNEEADQARNVIARAGVNNRTVSKSQQIEKIEINAAPGQSPEEIAEETVKALEASLFDDEEDAA